MSTLIRLGHVGAWAYPWPVYVAAIEEMRDAAKAAQAQTARSR